MIWTQKNYSCREHSPFRTAGRRSQACILHTAGPARWVCTHTGPCVCGKSQRQSRWRGTDKADSSWRPLRLRNSLLHRAHSVGLLYLAYISDRSQTSCHSCQGRRSQGCHCTDRADMILRVQKGVQSSLPRTSRSVGLCTQQGIHHRSVHDSGPNGRSG